MTLNAPSCPPPKPHTSFKALVAAAVLGGMAFFGISRAVWKLTPATLAAPESSLARIIAQVESGTVVISSATPDQDLPAEERPELKAGESGKLQIRKGSGFIIDSRGYIVTNNHVASKDQSKISVTLEDGTTYRATPVGSDKKLDISVLKIDAPDKKLTALSWGNSDALHQGDSVFAIGDPLEQTFTVTRGIVSALHRNFDGPYDDFIQTDAALNPGNSGGPLFERDGHVIGIDTSTIGGGNEGLGFAIPSAEAKQAALDIIAYGEVRRGTFGLTTDVLLSNDDDPEMPPTISPGAKVTIVDPYAPADIAGVTVGDIVTAFDGILVVSPQALNIHISLTHPGTDHQLTVLRNGNVLSMTVTADISRPPLVPEVTVSTGAVTIMPPHP